MFVSLPCENLSNRPFQTSDFYNQQLLLMGSSEGHNLRDYRTIVYSILDLIARLSIAAASVLKIFGIIGTVNDSKPQVRWFQTPEFFSLQLLLMGFSESNNLRDYSLLNSGSYCSAIHSSCKRPRNVLYYWNCSSITSSVLPSMC